MNSFITGMYAKKDRSDGTGSVEEKPCPVVPTSSGVSFSIDRTGSRPMHVIFDSDQQQESHTDLSDSVTICDPPVTAGTCQESAADDVILIEDNCSQGQHLTAGTSTPASPSVNKLSTDEQKLTVIHQILHTYIQLILFNRPSF